MNLCLGAVRRIAIQIPGFQAGGSRYCGQAFGFPW
jgi:hypothetical protein